MLCPYQKRINYQNDYYELCHNPDSLMFNKVIHTYIKCQYDNVVINVVERAPCKYINCIIINEEIKLVFKHELESLGWAGSLDELIK